MVEGDKAVESERQGINNEKENTQSSMKYQDKDELGLPKLPTGDPNNDKEIEELRPII